MSSLPPVATPPASGPSAEDRQWAMAAHLASLANLIFPFGAILGPLVVWLTKKDTSPFVDRHGKESLQFQVCFLGYHMVFVCGGLASFFGALVAADAIKGAGEPLAIFAMVAMFGLIAIALLMRVFVVVMMIIGASRANNGEEFRYPLTIRLLG